MFFFYLCIRIKKNMDEKHLTELGTERIPRLLLKYAMPAIAAMVAASVLNIVDSFFIGNYAGKNAISGMAATLPFINLATAFGAMVGVGAGSVISIRLGQKDAQTANHVLGNTITLNILIGLLVTIIGLLGMDTFLYWFGASDITAPYAKDYMQVLLLGNIVSHSFFGLNSVLRAGGHPQTAMYCTLLAVALNCVLDPLFIIVMDWGISGAAWATVLSQLVSLLWQLRILNRSADVLHFTAGTYKLHPSIVRQILAIGASPFLTNACASLVVLFINQSMRRWGDTLPIENGGDAALAAYGIDNRVVFFFLMIVIGLNHGMQPIAGYNWGARQDHRVRKVLILTMIAATCVTTIGFLTGELFPHQVVGIFIKDAPEVTAIAARGFRIDVAVFPIVGAQMVISSFFQSIGHAGKSIFLSMTRQMLFLIPGLYILPLWFGFDGVWWAIPLSDLLSFFVAVGMLMWLVRHLRKRNETHRTA